ncbi:winged helix-turn-helix domain-containing protein [Litoreibacter roseus]|nr:winged helix-turn-helix domain-containing protein [Litoreibacter roseus]
MIGLLAAMGLLSLVLSWRPWKAAATNDQLVLMPEHHSARRGTLEVVLTPRDFRLLEFLKSRQGKVVTKDELYDAGWGRDFMPNSRALDQHMINLRKKLDPDKSRAPVIETVRGVGYRLL